MRDLLMRLRAAWSPAAMIVLAVLLLNFSCMNMKREQSSAYSLEQRTSSVLSGVLGAGQVDVVIQMRKQEQNAGAMGSGIQEIPIGAIAVAQGADDPIVCQQLEQALCALLGLPVSAISIITGG